METRQDDFAVSGTPTLIVENINGDVEVTGSAEAGKVLVTARLRRPERLEYRATQEGNTVRVTVEQSQAGGNWWSRLWRRSGASDIAVVAPPMVNMHIHSSNGDISAHRVAGMVTLRTSNGDIEADGNDGVYDFRSSNGDIEVAAGRGEFSLHTSNGDIRFGGDPREGTENRLRTSNGNINARLTGEMPSVRVSASTSNGSIQLERSVAASELTEKNRLEGVIGDGAAALTLTTSNGTVTIE